MILGGTCHDANVPRGPELAVEVPERWEDHDDRDNGHASSKQRHHQARKHQAQEQVPDGCEVSTGLIKKFKEEGVKSAQV